MRSCSVRRQYLPVLRLATKGPHRTHFAAFTLLELLIVIGLTLLVMALVAPAFNSLQGGGAMTRAINEVSGLLELARAEAMATRSYVYLGFANTTNAEQNAELRVAAVISTDGSSDTSAANLRPLSKLTKFPNIQMVDYAGLPQPVKAAGDVSLQPNADYVVNFAPTAYLKDKFRDPAFDSCPTVAISPQGEILHTQNPLVFFRTTASVGLVPTRGTTRVGFNGAIVSYYGGTGQLRVTRPK